MDRTLRHVVLTLLAASTIWLGSERADAVDFAPSLSDARAAETVADDAQPRPVVLTFSAPWCGWCRKMAATTFADPEVAKVADQYLWVKVDPEDDPALSARMQVHGLPHTVLLDAENRVLGSQPGYMSPEAFLKFLEESLANPAPLETIPQTLLDGLAGLDDADDPAAIVRTAVEQVSKYEAGERELILQALHDAGPKAYPHLVTLLDDERLAVRAAAGSLLLKFTAAELPFDPFAKSSVQAEQTQAWQKWLAAQTTPETPSR